MFISIQLKALSVLLYEILTDQDIFVNITHACVLTDMPVVLQQHEVCTLWEILYTS